MAARGAFEALKNHFIGGFRDKDSAILRTKWEANNSYSDQPEAVRTMTSRTDLDRGILKGHDLIELQRDVDLVLQHRGSRAIEVFVEADANKEPVMERVGYCCTLPGKPSIETALAVFRRPQRSEEV